jgi:hypothetical protein
MFKTNLKTASREQAHTTRKKQRRASIQGRSANCQGRQATSTGTSAHGTGIGNFHIVELYKGTDAPVSSKNIY